jgi:virulence factor Mce-like protein
MSAKRRFERRQRVVFAAVALAIASYVVFLLVTAGGIPKPGSRYAVSAVLPSAGAQLVSGARVTMAGVEVGHVAGVELRGRGAVVKMQLTDASVTPIAAGTRAQLRSRSPLGENYISLIPGPRGKTLPEGATIPLAQAVGSVDVDEVLSMLRGKARQGARQLIGGLGRSVDGQGQQLNTLVGSAAGTIRHGAVVVNALYGERQQISQLVDQLGTVAARVGERDSDLRTIARDGTATFRAIAAQDSDVRKLAQVLPSTLRQVRQTTGKLASTSDVAAPVIDDLARTIALARPAARSLTPAATELRQVVDQLGSASPRLTRLLGALRKVSAPATATLPVVRKTLCQVNPILRYAKPYVGDLMGIITGLGSASNAYDAIGHTVRLAVTINENSLVGLPDSAATAAHNLLHAGLLSQSNGGTYIPFPGPGEGNRTSKDYPQVSGPDEVRAKTGYVYPHITADC